MWIYVSRVANNFLFLRQAGAPLCYFIFVLCYIESNVLKGVAYEVVAETEPDNYPLDSTRSTILPPFSRRSFSPVSFEDSPVFFGGKPIPLIRETRPTRELFIGRIRQTAENDSFHRWNRGGSFISFKSSLGFHAASNYPTRIGHLRVVIPLMIRFKYENQRQKSLSFSLSSNCCREAEIGSRDSFVVALIQPSEKDPCLFGSVRNA